MLEIFATGKCQDFLVKLCKWVLKKFVRMSQVRGSIFLESSTEANIRKKQTSKPLQYNKSWIYLFTDYCISIKKLVININKTVSVVRVSQFSYVKSIFLGYRDFPESRKFHATMEETTHLQTSYLFCRPLQVFLTYSFLLVIAWLSLKERTWSLMTEVPII